MNSEQFAYWINGYFEISGATVLNETQVKVIKDHLDLVFNKVTPTREPLPTITKLEPRRYCSQVNPAPYNEGLDKLDMYSFKTEGAFFSNENTGTPSC
jgi:hypothetical protein